MGDERDDAMVKPEENESEALTPLDEDLYGHLSPKQQKFVLRRVLTDLSDYEIGEQLGISDYMVRKWRKDPYVIEYEKQTMASLNDQELLNQHKRQNRWLRERMFEELASRFEDFDDAYQREFAGVPEEDISIQEKVQFKERFAKFTDFKNFFKLWDKTDKHTRLDDGEATDRTERSEIQHSVRKKYEELTIMRRTRNKLTNKADETAETGDNFDEFEEAAVEKGSEEPESEKPELVEADPVDEGDWEEEIEIEEWAFT